MTTRPASDPLVAATTRLIRRYGEVLSADVIRSVLHGTYQALVADATITTYLPVLAERFAARQLTTLADDPTIGPTDSQHRDLAAPPIRTVPLRGPATSRHDASDHLGHADAGPRPDGTPEEP